MNNSKRTQQRWKEDGRAETEEEARFEHFRRILGGLTSPRGVAPTMISHFHLLLLLLLLLLLPSLQGLAIHDPEEVEYVRSHIRSSAGASVSLRCGSAKPIIFIWGFTKPGTDNNVALAYDYGQGAKVQSQAGALGHIRVPANTSGLVIEELRREAGGMYTCQALYGTDEGAQVTFYFTRLEVEDN